MNDDAIRMLISGVGDLGINLNPSQVAQFQIFADELKKWNRKINLTAIKGDKEIVVKHFLDSLAVIMIDGINGRVLDIGSGAGFPSIPLKIADPGLEVVSVDAVDKKIIFQRHMQRLLGLKGFAAIHARAEELAGQYSASFNTVASRAFSAIPAFVRIALPLVCKGGKIVAMKGREGREEAVIAIPQLKEMGARVECIKEFQLPHSSNHRTLIVITKDGSGLSDFE